MQKALRAEIKKSSLLIQTPPDARIDEVKGETEDLFSNAHMLQIEDFDLYPFIYASGKDGYAAMTLEDPREKVMTPLLDSMARDFFPEPKFQKVQISDSHSPSYSTPRTLRRRIQRGSIKKHEQFHCVGEAGKKEF